MLWDTLFTTNAKECCTALPTTNSMFVNYKGKPVPKSSDADLVDQSQQLRTSG